MSARLSTPDVRRRFAQSARSYGPAAVIPREIGSRLLDRLGIIQLAPQAVLDLGCGPGELIAPLGERFPQSALLAADAVPALLRQAPKRIGWRRRVQRFCCDASAIPLVDRSVDLVVANLLLEWLEAPDSVFSGLARILRDDGLFLFTTLGPDSLIELRECWAQVDDSAHVHGFIDLHDLGDALLRAGFRDPVVDVERIQITYPDLDALFEEIRRLGCSNSLNERRRSLTGKRRYAEMRAQYERRQIDGRIPVTLEVIYGLAWGAPEGRVQRDPGGPVATFSVDRLRGSRRPR